ncbi:VOC family protein [Geodermatophilus bullaregiensis]|uniref:VOC family protein n=1 Tax=Geodermatophilus bullaregiensis TaxID=1564160 RepID=UPI001EF8C50C|nr:VOC family protein [Geodermatophilus bullaregiensis]
MLFVKLPVRDLAAARAFYEALGFRIEETSSDEGEAAVVLGEEIVVALHTRERFADLVSGAVGDPVQGPTAVHCLTADSPAAVDELVGRAVDAGARPGPSAQEEDVRYSRTFTDPDGNAWEIAWIGQLHVVN